jgi:hypothetical protein
MGQIQKTYCFREKIVHGGRDWRGVSITESTNLTIIPQFFRELVGRSLHRRIQEDFPEITIRAECL